MASLLLEDLLKDELAEHQVIPAWERAAISLFLRLDPVELSRVLLAEIGTMCPMAIVNLRAILDRAQSMHFSRMKFLKGGLAGWKANGYPVERYTASFHLDTRR